MIRNAAYEPPAEPAAPPVPEVFFVPPAGFCDDWNWSRIDEEVHTGRLAPWLRAAAQNLDPMSKLVASVRRRLASGPLAESDALADLAVTGRESYGRFLAQHPSDAALLAATLTAEPGANRAAAQAAVRATLDRAYSVAWALRGEPAHRAALRGSLGWIALSSEDDAPHAPTNRPVTGDYMGEFQIQPGGSGPTYTCRAAIKLPVAPASSSAPDLSTRPLPNDWAFQKLVRNRHCYDSLVLFIHGLASSIEESERYKQLLIEACAARGHRVAVLSIDMPGMGYSAPLDVDALVARRSRGHHGFTLPNGRGSNFPLLGLYRDVCVQLSRMIPGGIQHTMGGSLGGNLTLWLAATPMFTELGPTSTVSGIRSFASWSPASIWESYERSRDTPLEGNGTHMDVGKNASKTRALARMSHQETSGIRAAECFELMQRGEPGPLGIRFGAWGHPATRDGLLTQAEHYSAAYRRAFWMAAYEQVSFSHQEPLSPSNTWPFRTISTPLFLASGANDTGSSGVMDIYNEVVKVSDQSPDVPGRRLLMLHTSHSISDLRPAHLSAEVATFFHEHGLLSSPRIELFTRRGGQVWNRWQAAPNGGWNTEGFGSLGGDGLTQIQVARNADGRIELLGVSRGAIWHRWQVARDGGWNTEQWMSLEGARAQQFVIGTNADGRLELFALDDAGIVHNRWQVQPNGIWNTEGWGSLRGSSPLGSGLRQLHVAANADGRLELFALNATGQVCHRWQTAPNGGWNTEGWMELGGSGFQELAVGSNMDGRLELFALDAAGSVQNRWQTSPGGVWNVPSWGSLSGAGAAGTGLRQLQVGSNADGRLELFALTAGGAVRHRWQSTPNGRWNSEGWMELDGSGFRQLAVASNADCRLELFAIDAAGTTRNRWQVRPSGPWNLEGWGSLGGNGASEVRVI